MKRTQRNSKKQKHIEEDIKSRGYFCNCTDETIIISQRKRDDSKSET